MRESVIITGLRSRCSRIEVGRPVCEEGALEKFLVHVLTEFGMVCGVDAYRIRTRVHFGTGASRAEGTYA